jgi:hypothetical protein
MENEIVAELALFFSFTPRFFLLFSLFVFGVLPSGLAT